MTNKYLAIGMLPLTFFSYADEAVNLGEMSITTASRFSEPVSTVLAPTSVLTREEIEKLGANSLVDALKTLPGIEIGQNGGRGQNASIFMRGTESNHTLVLVDGVRLPTNILTSIDFNMLPLNAIERIEVIRGAGARVYGSDAIGGVINIITRSEAKKRHISIGIGSMGTGSSSIAVTESINDKMDVQIMGGFEKTDGYNVHPSYAEAGEEHGFTSKNFSLRFGYQPTQQLQANLFTRWYQNEVEYDAYGSLKIGWVENRSIGADASYLMNNWQHLFRLEYTEQTKFDYPIGQVRDDNTLNHEINQIFANYSSRLQATENFALTFGADFTLEKYIDGSVVAVDSIDSHRQNVGFYSLANWQLHNAVLLEASARYDDNQQYGNFTTAQFGLGWDIAKSYRVYVSVGNAFKAPSIIDLYGSSGNLLLKPEESVNYELGLQGFHQYFDWSLNLYQNDIDNLITSVGKWPNSVMKNVEKAQIRGVELATNFDLWLVSNQLSLEFRDPQDKSKNEQLARRGKMLAKWQGSMSFDRLTLGLLFNYQSERPDYSGGKTLDAYSVWDLTAQYPLNKNVALRAKIANLFDKDYETAGDYPAAERAYYINVDFTF